MLKLFPGVEMSSDDDTPSIENDTNKKPEPKEEKKEEAPMPLKSVLKQRFRMLKNRTTFKEGTIDVSSLQNLQRVSTGVDPNVSDLRDEEVESGVDALEDEFCTRDNEPGTSTGSRKKTHPISKKWMKDVAQNIDNMEVDENSVLNVREVSGTEMRTMYLAGADSRTIFAPSGFVDLRSTREVKNDFFW